MKSLVYDDALVAVTTKAPEPAPQFVRLVDGYAPAAQPMGALGSPASVEPMELIDAPESPASAEPVADSLTELSPSKDQALYLQIAMRFVQMVASGTLKAGQRLPSVRDTATHNAVAVATVLQAFHYLEEHSLVQPRPKSGYFVRSAAKAKALALLTGLAHPAVQSVALLPTPKTLAQQPPLVSFSGYAPKDGGLYDMERIRSAVARASRLQRRSLLEYVSDSGTLALRSAVALRALHLGCALDAQRLIVTASCIQAVTMCLQVVTKPGDMVAIESPTFFGFLDLLESLNLKALPLPTDERTGISLPALQLALATQPVRALLMVPTLSNPTGAVMPLAHKRELARLVAQHQIPLIEDLVFNDLLASDARRKAVKAFDTEGWVMACGSFAKTVAPGIRMGWIEAGRWHKELATLKRIQGAATNAVLEHALADLLTQGSYEAHLRRLCNLMKQRLQQARGIIEAHFPKGTKINNPPAGYTLWVELPKEVDTMALFAVCKAQGIAIGPGALFCASQRYFHFVRLGFTGAWGETEHKALAEVGRLACALQGRSATPNHANEPPPSRMNVMCYDEVSAHEVFC